MSNVPESAYYAIEVYKNDPYRLIVGVSYDGCVTFGDGITPTEAAREMWEALTPYVANGLGMLKKEHDQLRTDLAVANEARGRAEKRLAAANEHAEEIESDLRKRLAEELTLRRRANARAEAAEAECDCLLTELESNQSQVRAEAAEAQLTNALDWLAIPAADTMEARLRLMREEISRLVGSNAGNEALVRRLSVESEAAEAKAQQAEADAAAVRRDINAIIQPDWEDYSDADDGEEMTWHLTLGEARQLRKALSGTAGRDLLAELTELRKVVDSECPIGAFDLATTWRTEKAGYLKHVEQLEADAAVMRSHILGAMTEYPFSVWSDVVAGIWAHLQKALKPDAGRDLLARLERYERALRDIKLNRQKTHTTPYPCHDDAWWLASEALEGKPNE